MFLLVFPLILYIGLFMLDFIQSFSSCSLSDWRYKCIRYKLIKLEVYVCVLSCFSHVQLFMTLWTVAYQAPLSIGLSKQEYQSGLPCPPPGDLPDPAVKPTCLMSPSLAGSFFTTSATWEAPIYVHSLAWSTMQYWIRWGKYNSAYLIFVSPSRSPW